jgi:ubiquitin-like protein Pup
MPQETAYRPTPTNPTTTTSAPQPPVRAASAHTDELLDDIDSVLETNALEVVRAYVQRPGQ